MEQLAVRIVIADDHPLIRDGISTFLTEIEEVSEVLTASSFDELTNTLHRHDNVGLALLDLNMPGMDDVASLQSLQSAFPSVTFAILSATEIASVAIRFLEAGAAGYIPKSADNEILLSAVRLILAGGVYVPPFALKTTATTENQPDSLTERQFEVLEMIAQGLSNKGIARALDISESTVKSHTNAILRTLDVDNRTKAIHVALRRGILESP